MENLTVKHLAPYLGYGLKCFHKSLPNNKLVVYGLTDNNIINCLGKETFLINEIKPLLRPIEQLGDYMDVLDIFPYSRVSHIESGLINESLSYKAMKELFKYHFDVFGLIQCGLAIDINTIQAA